MQSLPTGGRRRLFRNRQARAWLIASSPYSTAKPGARTAQSLIACCAIGLRMLGRPVMIRANSAAGLTLACVGAWHAFGAFSTRATHDAQVIPAMPSR